MPETIEEKAIRISDLINDRNWKALRSELEAWPSAEIADLMSQIEKNNRVLLYRALGRSTAAEVFSHLPIHEQNALLHDLTNEEARALLSHLSPDDRTTLLAELPGQVTQKLMNLLSPEDLREARWLLGYPEDSVGRLMTPDYVAVKPEWTVEQSLQHIRARGKDSETINRIYVVDDNWRLLDDIQLRYFIIAPPETRVSELMDYTVVSLSAFSDREEAAALIQRYDQSALPVIDSEGVLIGIVTVDDLLDVVEQEVTEDFHRVASIEPIRISVTQASIGELYRARVVWMLVLLGMNIFSGAGIAAFEELIQRSVALVFFLPLLIASGGNAGSQSATLMIRAIAIGDVGLNDWLKLLKKEIVVSLTIGLTMAIGVSFIALFRAPDLIAIVALTITVVVLFSSLIGMSLPFAFTRLGLDPATASVPLITSLADVSGVVIYFSIATLYLI